MSDVHEFSSIGWNTFDVRSLAAAVHLPTGLEVKIGLTGPGRDLRHREFRWPELARLGLHTPDCSYAAVMLQAPECRLMVEFASEDDLLAVRAVPTGDPGDLRPFADVFLFPGFEGQVALNGRAAVVQTSEKRFVVSSPGGGPDDQLSFPGEVTFTAGQGCELLLWVAEDDSRISQEAAAGFISRKREEAESWEHRYDEHHLQSAFEGMWRSVIWNTIYAPSIARPVTVVSRDWCVDGNYGDFVLFEWDTFFAALQSCTCSRELAYNNVRAVLSGITERGFVPSIFCELGKSRDRSMLPVGSYIVYKLYQEFGDVDFLEEVFPALLGWHRWWMTSRDGNGDGLLEWGSDDYPSPHPQWQSHNLQAARYESGLDNSPMYDDVEFDEQASTMRLTDVGLNSAYLMDTWALAQIAAVIGHYETAEALRIEHGDMKQRMNDVLWSDAAGIYLNRRWNGDFYKRLSPTLFYPMIARAAAPEQAEVMVRRHLLSEQEFWGPHIIPSIARSDPAFADQQYWRGRIWGPMNWLVYEGLKAYHFDEVAREMGEKCLKTFLAEWQEESHVHENYNCITGEGDDVRYSEPVYFWGGLLAMIGLLENR